VRLTLLGRSRGHPASSLSPTGPCSLPSVGSSLGEAAPLGLRPCLSKDSRLSVWAEFGWPDQGQNPGLVLAPSAGIRFLPYVSYTSSLPAGLGVALQVVRKPSPVRELLAWRLTHAAEGARLRLVRIGCWICRRLRGRERQPSSGWIPERAMLFLQWQLWSSLPGLAPAFARATTPLQYSGFGLWPWRDLELQGGHPGVLIPPPETSQLGGSALGADGTSRRPIPQPPTSCAGPTWAPGSGCWRWPCARGRCPPAAVGRWICSSPPPSGRGPIFWRQGVADRVDPALGSFGGARRPLLLSGAFDSW